jgi:sugar phosphate isomerase/epimerase
MNREQFLRSLGMAAMGATLGGSILSACAGKSSSDKPADTTSTASVEKAKELFFKISLAEWSFHKALFAKEFEHLDFPVKAKNEYGISGVEYVNQFFKDKAKDQKYLAELKKRCEDNGVTSVLIMIDGEGEMANTDTKKRMKAVENHYQWVDAAKFLGCHSIRVNCFGVGTPEEVAKAGTDGLRKLSEYAQKVDIGVIVENHGGLSSSPPWLTSVIKNVGLPNCGVLPDFGNFSTKRENGSEWSSKCIEEYDKYKGVGEMMPFAKGVSAKTHDFDAQGNCTDTDFSKMLPIVKASGFHGWMGIEYEGEKLPEPEGVKLTKALLERVGMEVS